jgi:uncharacterized protein
MASYGIILFFAVTGLTLNHQDRFNWQQKTNEFHGKIDPRWVKTTDGKDVAKPEIVQYLRRNHGIRAALADFRVDDSQCEVSFRGPGYEADAFIERETGAYQVTESRMGLVAVINDLHKARDTGRRWAAIIDISAALMICVSLSGFMLIFFLHKRRNSGMLTLAVGLFAFYLFYRIFVP